MGPAIAPMIRVIGSEIRRSRFCLVGISILITFHLTNKLSQCELRGYRSSIESKTLTREARGTRRSDGRRWNVAVGPDSFLDIKPTDPRVGQLRIRSTVEVIHYRAGVWNVSVGRMETTVMATPIVGHRQDSNLADGRVEDGCGGRLLHTNTDRGERNFAICVSEI